MDTKTLAAVPVVSAFPGSATIQTLERPSSLGQLCRRHCRERLLVLPLQWTDRHLQLLQCSYDESRLADPDCQSRIRESANFLFNKIILDQWKRDSREKGLANLLTDPAYPLERGRGIVFHFNLRVVIRLACTPFVPRVQTESDAPLPTAPVVAHVDLARLEDIRWNTMRPYLGTRRGRDTTWNLFKLKLKSITPKEPLRDPYIAAILIGMAQMQRRASPRWALRRDERRGLVFLPKVLVSSQDKKNLYLFAAEISSEFLNKFDDMTFVPHASASMVIGVTMIPYLPHGTLRDRVFQLLLLPRKDDVDISGSSHCDR